MREIHRIDQETGELVETLAQAETEAGSGEYPEVPDGFVDVPPPTLAVRPTWNEETGEWEEGADEEEVALREAKREKREEVMARARELLGEVEAAGTVEEVEAASSWEDGQG